MIGVAGSMGRRKTRTIMKRLALVIGGVLLALVVMEVILHGMWAERVRSALLPFLHMLDAQVEIHQPDPDPRVVLRLKPGSQGHDADRRGRPFTINVNSLGFRGEERTAVRPEGVFRIIVVGGSNVYGGSIADHETWPYKLEERLNAESPGKYEVWNGGVASYNSLQMAAVAEKYIEKYAPNMLIFAPSNPTPRFFLHGTPDILSYFRRDLTLWEEILPPVHPGRGWGDRLPRWLRLGLLGYSSLARVLLMENYVRESIPELMNHKCAPACTYPHYIQASRGFLRSASKKTKVVVFIAPFVIPMSGDCFEAHYEGLGLPVFVLDSEGKPDQYRLSHPPVGVMKWYASNLDNFMRGNDLLPPVGARGE